MGRDEHSDHHMYINSIHAACKYSAILSWEPRKISPYACSLFFLIIITVCLFVCFFVLFFFSSSPIPSAPSSSFDFILPGKYTCMPHHDYFPISAPTLRFHVSTLAIWRHFLWWPQDLHTKVDSTMRFKNIHSMTRAANVLSSWCGKKKKRIGNFTWDWQWSVCMFLHSSGILVYVSLCVLDTWIYWESQPTWI